MGHRRIPPEITRRPYADEDMPRLQAALAGWIAAAGTCGYCHIGELPHRIDENLAGRRPAGELVHLWEQDGRPVALAICCRFDAAFDLFVAPEHRGGPLEREGLRFAHELTARLVRELQPPGPAVLSDVYSCDATRKALLAELGFREERQWDNVVERSLAEPIPEPLPPPGFVLRRATMADYAGLAEARSSAFGGGWTPEGFRDAVMRKPGYSPDDELVAVAPDGRVAAFAVARLDARNRRGLFEPVGVHAAFRRRGLARALLLAGLRAMGERGMASAQLSYDATNLAAHHLYAGLGFRLRDITLGYAAAPAAEGVSGAALRVRA
jgi:ribosomal protein S18 acetylase RimI-like enzyme